MSRGPFLVEGELVIGGVSKIDADKPVLRVKGELLGDQYFFRNNFHRSKRDATDDVLERFLKREVALKKAMATLKTKRDRALKMIEAMDI